MEMLRRMEECARADETGPCFLGAGSYDHHIPSAVWDIASRGEFMTAYTPYQAEASQGTLQLVYEFQTMMAELTGMDVCNASVYDGGSGLAEAILMAVRAGARRSRGRPAGGRRSVALAGAVHPLYVAAARNIVRQQDIEIVQLPHGADGLANRELLTHLPEPPAAVVVQQPNFFGLLEDVDAMTDQARECGALTVACVNPLTLGLLKPPADWGAGGADIVCGDGQPLGIPMASGGPSFGFICTRQSLVRQMPGRIVGRTRDLDGKPGFTLTLQAREQHIRRAKATSNICTNPGFAGDRRYHPPQPSRTRRFAQRRRRLPRPNARIGSRAGLAAAIRRAILSRMRPASCATGAGGCRSVGGAGHIGRTRAWTVLQRPGRLSPRMCDGKAHGQGHQPVCRCLESSVVKAF